MIEVQEEFPRCHIRRPDGSGEDRNLDLGHIAAIAKAGVRVGLYVDGWTEPWQCFLDGSGHLRARCPKSAKVVPLVVNIPPHGVTYTGKE